MHNLRWNDRGLALLCRAGGLAREARTLGEAVMDMEQVPGFRSVNPHQHSFEPEASARAASGMADVEPEDDDDPGEVPPLRFPVENSAARRRGEDVALDTRPDAARQRELLQHLAPLDFSIHVS